MGLLDSIRKALKIKGSDKDWDEEIAREDTMMKSSEELYLPGSDSASAGHDFKNTGQFQVEFERLWGQVAALREQISVAGEHTNRLNEEIGEVRAIAIEQEKDASSLKIQAERAATLVEAVQPDQLRKEIRRIDVRLEELAGVDEKLERMQQTVMEEMRLMRERMEVVRGGDTLLSLNEEVKSELNSIRKLEALTSKHADSVESIYIETQKGMSEIKNLKESMDEAHREISGFTADITELRKKANAAPEKADITRLEDLLKKQDARAVSSDATLKKLEDTIATLKEKAAWLDQRVTTLSGPSAKPGEQGTNPSSDNLPKE